VSYAQWDDDPWADAEAIETARRDVDLETAEMDRVGDATAAAQRAGRCTHGSAQGYTGGPRWAAAQEGLKWGQLRCTAGCAAVFADDDGWHASIDEAIDGFL